MRPDRALNFKRGRESEGVVKSYLLKKGYQFIEANFLVRTGEIDLVFLDSIGQRKTLVFVEVRSALKENKLLKYSIGPKKRIRLKKTILQYLFRRRFENMKFRVDLVWVSGEKIEHWTNIEI